MNEILDYIWNDSDKDIDLGGESEFESDYECEPEDPEQHVGPSLAADENEYNENIPQE